MKQTSCKLCGKTFICDNGMWFTTCTCAKDRSEELKKAQEKFDRECQDSRQGEEMTNLQPGPEMDAAVARALGWTPDRNGWWYTKGKEDYVKLPQFSTDDACAVRDVLPEMIRRWPKSMLSITWNAGWWYCGRANEDLVHEGRDTLAHAICRAFLEAVEKTTT